MLTLQAIRDGLQDRRVSLVSKATGLHYNTIRDVRDNPKANPTYRVISLLSDYLTDSRQNAEDERSHHAPEKG